MACCCCCLPALDMVCVLRAGAPGRTGAAGAQAGGLLENGGMVLRDPSTFHLIVQQVCLPPPEPLGFMCTSAGKVGCLKQAQMHASPEETGVANCRGIRGVTTRGITAVVQVSRIPQERLVSVNRESHAVRTLIQARNSILRLCALSRS